MTPRLITFAEAEAIGTAIHDRFIAMSVTPPMKRDDMGWADIAQFVARQIGDAISAREDKEENDD